MTSTCASANRRPCMQSRIAHPQGSSLCHRRQQRAVRCNALFMGSSDKSHAAKTFTFVTSDGLVRLQGTSPSPAQSYEQVVQSRPPMPTREEQGLCLGSTFWVAATNGVDPARRIKIAGFCQSMDLLAEVVEHSVRKRGGEIMHCESQMNSSLHENLKMIVAIPLLWGVPPEHEALRDAITLGGGIVDKVYRQWFWY